MVRGERVCKKCILNELEDEFHFILVCPLYKDLRSLYIKRYYYNRPSMFKLVQLLSIKNKKALCNLSKFIIKALKLRSV